MVKRHAIIIGGGVDNVILWDGEAEWTPPAGAELVELHDDQVVGPGFAWNGVSFTAPLPAPSDEPAP